MANGSKIFSRRTLQMPKPFCNFPASVKGSSYTPRKQGSVGLFKQRPFLHFIIYLFFDGTARFPPGLFRFPNRRFWFFNISEAALVSTGAFLSLPLTSQSFCGFRGKRTAWVSIRASFQEFASMCASSTETINALRVFIPCCLNSGLWLLKYW